MKVIKVKKAKKPVKFPKQEGNATLKQKTQGRFGK